MAKRCGIKLIRLKPPPRFSAFWAMAWHFVVGCDVVVDVASHRLWFSSAVIES